MDAVKRMNNNINQLMDASGPRGVPSRQIAIAADAGSKTAVTVCAVFIAVLVVAVVIGAIVFTCRDSSAEPHRRPAQRPAMIQHATARTRTAPTRQAQAQTTGQAKANRRRKMKNGDLHKNKIKLSQIGKSRQAKAAPGAEGGASRSQQLHQAIHDLKKPAKTGLTGGQLENRSRNEATIGSYKTASNSNMATRKVGATIDAGRLARSMTEEARDTIMKKGRDSRLNKEQIRQGILKVGRKNTDPSRKSRVTRGLRSLGVNQEAWRKKANRKTPLTANVPCGANPSIHFYDALKRQQEEQAIASR